MMIATKCPSADELHALSTGQLADERDDELLEHIRGCEACRSTLETVVDAEDSLIASLRSPDALAVFDAEPQCKVAVLNALGALTQSSQLSAGGDAGYVPKSIGEY